MIQDRDSIDVILIWRVNNGEIVMIVFYHKGEPYEQTGNRTVIKKRSKVNA